MSLQVSVVVLDTETTDSTDGECIELAALALESISDASPALVFQRRYQPVKPSTLGALTTHHILDHELEGCPPSANAAEDAVAASYGCRYWIGHNIDFDWTVLGKPPVFRICTLALARRYLPDLDSHKLAAVYYHVFGRTEAAREMVQRAHGAYADVLMLRQLLPFFVDLAGGSTDPQALFAASEEARIPRKWTFGKFEDQPISAADRGYAQWFRRTCTDRPDYEHYLTALRRVGLL